MGKILTLLLVLILSVPAAGKTLDSLLQDVRKLTGDMETPNVWRDSTLENFIDRAIHEVAVLGLSYTVWDTLLMVDDTLTYSLSQEPIELITAFRLNEGGGIEGVSLINVNEVWKAHDDWAYALVDNVVFVTMRLSEHWKFVVVFTALPQTLSDTSATFQNQLPKSIETAVTYMAASTAMISTRVQTNIAIGQGYRQMASEIIKRWLQARRGKPTDSLALPR